MGIHVERVDAATTVRLRRAVLRPHHSMERVAREAAEETTSEGFACFAALDEAAAVVGCGTIRREEAPFAQDEQAWRIRSMAVEPELRGQGIGAAVLDALLDHAVRHGGGTVWCNARTPAIGLYRRAGFEARGDEFEIAGIGPHFVMTRVAPAIEG